MQLSIALQHAVVPHCYALGIFSRDTIPIPHCYPSCLIANSDSSYEHGTHWLALFFESPYHTEFFDRYGLMPFVYGINYLPNKFNNQCFQSERSTVCGQFCLYYLYYRCRGLSLSDVQSNLNSCAPLLNDHKVNCFVHKYFQIPHFHSPIPCYCIQSCCARKK